MPGKKAVEAKSAPAVVIQAETSEIEKSAEVIDLEGPVAADSCEKLYRPLILSSIATKEICDQLDAGKDVCSLLVRELDLAESNSIEGNSFDPTIQAPKTPDFKALDDISRDKIYANYLSEALKFGRGNLFTNLQLAAWATIFHSTHQAFVKELVIGGELYSKSCKKRRDKCLGLFRENLYRLAFSETLGTKFMRHQVRQMIDYFVHNYITHINLITAVFSRCQTRIVYKKSLPLAHPTPCASLDDGIEESRLQEYLLEEKKGEEESRLQAQVKENEMRAAIEESEKAAKEVLEKNEQPHPITKSKSYSCLHASKLFTLYGSIPRHS